MPGSCQYRDANVLHRNVVYGDGVATPRRFQGPGFFHVYTRATGGGPFCIDEEDRNRVVERLDRVSRRLGWRIHAYTVMTTHYHLVLETRSPTLSRGMQQINSVCVRRFNERWNRYGTLVSCRFGYRIIEDEEYLSEVSRYVLLNPVRAGLCRRAADWPWSGGRMFHLANDI